MEPDNLLLDEYFISQTGKRQARGLFCAHGVGRRGRVYRGVLFIFRKATLPCDASFPVPPSREAGVVHPVAGRNLHWRGQYKEHAGVVARMGTGSDTPQSMAERVNSRRS